MWMRSAKASGDCAHMRSTSSGGQLQPSRGVHSTPRSQFAAAATWFDTPFAETAARKRSVCPTSQLVMNPP